MSVSTKTHQISWREVPNQKESCVEQKGPKSLFPTPSLTSVQGILRLSGWAGSHSISVLTVYTHRWNSFSQAPSKSRGLLEGIYKMSNLSKSKPQLFESIEVIPKCDDSSHFPLWLKWWRLWPIISNCLGKWSMDTRCYSSWNGPCPDLNTCCPILSIHRNIL